MTGADIFAASLLGVCFVPLWVVLFGAWPVPPLVDWLFTKKTLDKCHKSKHSYSWADYLPCSVCNKGPNNWRHWPDRLRPHEFKAHIRKDITGSWPTKFCDKCNKDKYFVLHTNVERGLFGAVQHEKAVAKARAREDIRPVKDKIRELEKWHDDFRLRHPELEDKVRNEIFPELRPKAPGEGEMLSKEEIDYRMGMGL